MIPVTDIPIFFKRLISIIQNIVFGLIGFVWWPVFCILMVATSPIQLVIYLINGNCYLSDNALDIGSYFRDLSDDIDWKLFRPENKYKQP